MRKLLDDPLAGKFDEVLEASQRLGELLRDGKHPLGRLEERHDDALLRVLFDLGAKRGDASHQRIDQVGCTFFLLAEALDGGQVVDALEVLLGRVLHRLLEASPRAELVLEARYLVVPSEHLLGFELEHFRLV